MIRTPTMTCVALLLLAVAATLVKRDLLVPFRPRHFDKIRDEVKDPMPIDYDQIEKDAKSLKTRFNEIYQ